MLLMVSEMSNYFILFFHSLFEIHEVLQLNNTYKYSHYMYSGTSDSGLSEIGGTT